MADTTSQLINFYEAPFTPVHRKIMWGTFMGLICDGYVLGIVGIALVYAQGALLLTPFWSGLLAAGSMFGILFGSMFTGMISDRIGRRKLYTLLMMLSALVGVSQFFISNLVMLVAIRFILGMLVGADYAVSISYLNEWTSPKRNGAMLGWLLVFWAIGYTLSYIAGVVIKYAFGIEAGVGGNLWRWVICSSTMPAVIALIIRIGSPESPKWLVAKKRFSEAQRIVDVHVGRQYTLPEVEEITVASWWALWSRRQWRKTFVSGFFFLAQVLPFFGLSLSLQLVLDKVGITNPEASGILYNLFTLAGVVLGALLIDRVGRRGYLIWTFYGCALLMGVLCIFKNMPPVMALIVLSAFALMLAVAIVPEFPYPAELFPTELRGSGVGLTVAISRIGAGMGSFLLPIVTDSYGVYASLWFCVGILVAGGIVCQMWAPETNPNILRNVPKATEKPVVADL